MPYATPADLQTDIGVDIYNVIADRDGDGAGEDATAEDALAKATSIVDSYIAPYLPLATVPESVKDATTAIAVWKLRVARDLTTEDSRREYEAVMAWLRDVASGKASLGLPEPADEGPGEVLVESCPRVFTRRSMRGVL